jgi:hypothetical protein
MSKPELVMQDFAGYHNSDLDKTSARLMQGGSWKRQRVVVVMPAAKDISAKVVLTWLNLGFPPNNGVLRILALGMEVGVAYSTAVENIISHPDFNNWEFILCLEHDNAPPPDGVIKLIETLEEHKELAAVGGLYFTKGEGGVAQIWGDPRDPVTNYRPQVPIMNGLQECCGTGMGFTLFRTEIFKDKRLRRPWFKTLGVPGEKDWQGIATQDLYFWGDARKFGYRCAIDTRVRVGHYDKDNDKMW